MLRHTIKGSKPICNPLGVDPLAEREGPLRCEAAMFERPYTLHRPDRPMLSRLRARGTPSRVRAPLQQVDVFVVGHKIVKT